MITFFSHSSDPLSLLSPLSLSTPNLSSALSHSFLPLPYLFPAAVRVICLLWGEPSGCSLPSPGPQGSASWWEDSGCQSPTPQSPETKLQGHSGDGGECVSVKLLWRKWRLVCVAYRHHCWYMLFSIDGLTNNWPQTHHLRFIITAADIDELLWRNGCVHTISSALLLKL